METERFQRKLRADDVRAAGIRLVPSLIVNGLELYAPDPRQLNAVVEKQLEIARRLRNQEDLSGAELHEALIQYNEGHTEEVWLVR